MHVSRKPKQYLIALYFPFSQTQNGMANVYEFQFYYSIGLLTTQLSAPTQCAQPFSTKNSRNMSPYLRQPKPKAESANHTNP